MAFKAFMIGANTLGLRYASNDILLLNEALKKYNYNITIPTLNKSDIISKFDNFIDDSDKADTLIFYFSGHGFSPRGKLLLVIGDDLSKNKNLISIDYIINALEDSNSINKVIILDCCKAGSIVRDWQPNISERFLILTSSEQLEISKEIDSIESSFLSYQIHKALTVSFDQVSVRNRIKINELYEWLLNETEKYNIKNNTSKVPLPNLLGNRKINFEIALLSSMSISLKEESFLNEVHQITQFKTKRYLRERCRIFIEGSNKFNEIMSSLLSNNYNEKLLDSYKSTIAELKSDYEYQMALAAFHEKKGKFEKMLEILNKNILKGEKESNRLLYRALVFEKLDRLDNAINDLYNILRTEDNNNIIKAAQFNLNICYEKKNEYNKVNFPRFFKFKDIIFVANERLCDKAIAMHLIFCHKSNEEFLYNKELKETLSFQAKYNPIGYTKTIMNFFNLENKKLSDKEIEDIYNLKDQMNINIRIAVLGKLVKHLDKIKDKNMIEIIIKDMKSIHQISKSYAIKKFLDETLEYYYG